MSDLTYLAKKFGCDKLWSHSYIDFYEQLFEGRTVHRLLEIGIGFEDLMKAFVPFYVHGASLRMWADYFPDAEIFACDIREDTLINEGRIHSVVCDQSNAASLIDMAREFGTGDGEQFDVVIDDGSHQFSDQILTAKVLLPCVAKGGAYVIEDVRDRVHAGKILIALMDYANDIKIHEFNKRSDDTLVVIEK
jgi:hypothetical protein